MDNEQDDNSSKSNKVEKKSNVDYDDEKIPLTFLDFFAMMIAIVQLLLPYLIAIVIVYFLFILFTTKIWLI